ncbi:MAG: hypothetical protein ACR2L0_09440 [Gaiellaceae bacterium]
MSADEARALASREPAHWGIAGYLAAIVHFVAPVALVYYPGRIGPGTMFVALLAAALAGPRQRWFAATAVTAATVWWFFGMVIAIALDRPLF